MGRHSADFRLNCQFKYYSQSTFFRAIPTGICPFFLRSCIMDVSDISGSVLCRGSRLMRFVLLFLFVLRLNSAWVVWVDISSHNAPEARSLHTAVWTGQEMIVWGGYDGRKILNSGGIYNPQTNTWQPISIENSPAARSFHTAVWTGQEMIVWSGEHSGRPLSNGGNYKLSK